MKTKVVIGFVGTQLDAGDGPGRWERWRPTVSLGLHEDFLVGRMELLVDERRNAKTSRLIREDLAQVSPETDVRIHDTYIANPWDFESVYETLYAFAQGYAFDPDNEDYYVHITTGTHVAQICLFLLTESRHLPGRLLQASPPRKQGVAASVGELSIIDLDLSRYDRLAQRFEGEQQEDRSHLKSGIATRNAAFNRMIEQIETVGSRSVAPILLMGPTGAGKSQLARRLFELKQGRREVTGRFVEVNCATLRGDGAMSALFGHVKGAYTGAAGERAGLLRSADKGLLFLDEIGELGADEQAMLLRALEDKRFLPVGGDREASSDFQLIAGTNRDLGKRVAEGRFRDDLYARLNIWSFHLPGLAERMEDIEPNLDYELERYARDENRRVTFNKEAREVYLAFAMSSDAPWSGNFRDLGASVTRMATLAPAGRINRACVDEEIGRLRRLWRQESEGDALRELLGEAVNDLDLFDRLQLREVIAVCQRCRSLSEAGRQLFAASRSKRASTNDADRLRKYLARYELSWDVIARR
ncbi:transcriptional regulator [Luteibacter rhizovicinus DSM 16549]|uniref:Transcriptional regulator n=1 Tax=Luteibacter rhizovicinus DSM 16549 TaxID=1440763 RepID=A0A0G9HA86_9GAMM|nr:RNA repair transcriptional activator RtcR [Luteibacter rhizovicinus]APG03734.1 transcriptional regulator [Luteibacter rhizovicinus DSM 16549]KLD66690.1 transcriptional regulator [Luteibacter rhizovicinus DSM 16549]